jgi:serine/threonine-protein kinase
MLLSLLPFLSHAGKGRTVLVAALGASGIASAWLLWSIDRDERYDPWRLLLVGAVWLAVGLAALRYFEVFSPFVCLLCVGVLFFGMTRDARAQTLAYGAASVAYLVTALAWGRAGSGAATRGTAESIALVAFTESLLALTFVLARGMHTTASLVLARADRLARQVAQKESLAAELQKELARALDVAGVGRFSDTVVGRYKLGAVIGRGAMGEIYEATHEETRAEAAVKLLHAHTLREPGAVERFLREARTAAELDTQHVVRILDVGGFDGGLPYLAMERLRGEDLADMLRQRPTLTLGEIARLLTEIGAGLAAARSVGVVHRDVKPRNLFLARGAGPELGGASATWKLLDFGVSKYAGADSTVADGRIIGTPEYMAPEQAAGGPVTHRTDLFSLALVVYRALTGQQAFVGDHLVEVLYQVMNAMPPAPSAIADVPAEVDLVMAISLAKSPGDRFDTAEEMRDALVAAVAGDVPVELRARAERLIAAHPWGERAVGEA